MVHFNIINACIIRKNIKYKYKRERDENTGNKKSRAGVKTRENKRFTILKKNAIRKEKKRKIFFGGMRLFHILATEILCVGDLSVGRLLMVLFYTFFFDRPRLFLIVADIRSGVKN